MGEGTWSPCQTVSAQAWQFESAERELRDLASSALGDNITLALLMLISVALVSLVVYRLSAVEVGEQTRWPTRVYSALDPRP